MCKNCEILISREIAKSVKSVASNFFPVEKYHFLIQGGYNVYVSTNKPLLNDFNLIASE